MNLQYGDGSRSFAKETRALKMSTQWPAIRSWKPPIESIIKADPLTTTQKVAEEPSVGHSTIIWHLKQIGKVKKLDSRCLVSWPKKKKNHRFVVSSSYRMQQWQTIFQSDCDMMKSGFYTTTGQLAMTSWVAELRRGSKALPKAKFAWKKGHGHCLVVCCPSDPLQLLNPGKTITSEK